MNIKLPAGGTTLCFETKGLAGLQDSMQRALGGDPETVIEACRIHFGRRTIHQKIEASAIERAIHEAQ